jgi:hypothetical protein
MSSTNDTTFAFTKEAYVWLRGKDCLGLPEAFEQLTPSQQSFFMDFFENCKEVQCEEKEKEEKTDDFLAVIQQKLGEVGEHTVENILYEMNLTVVEGD